MKVRVKERSMDSSIKEATLRIRWSLSMCIHSLLSQCYYERQESHIKDFQEEGFWKRSRHSTLIQNSMIREDICQMTQIKVSREK